MVRPGKVFQATESHSNSAVKDWYLRSARQRLARHCAPYDYYYYFWMQCNADAPPQTRGDGARGDGLAGPRGARGRRLSCGTEGGRGQLGV